MAKLYLLDSLLKCREREWGYCFKFWKALMGQALVAFGGKMVYVQFNWVKK